MILWQSSFNTRLTTLMVNLFKGVSNMKKLKELKDTEAEWIIDYLDGERNYICSHCGYYALYDIAEHALDSHFCPHCGRSMINSTQPWTERCK